LIERKKFLARGPHIVICFSQSCKARNVNVTDEDDLPIIWEVLNANFNNTNEDATTAVNKSAQINTEVM